MPLAILHASQLWSGNAVRQNHGKRLRGRDPGIIEDGAMVIETASEARKRRPRVLWVGPSSSLPKKFLRTRRKSLAGKHAILPGFVDCHTHLVFAGDRSEEFARRCAGESYAEIAQRGGGIQATVRATREATTAQLKKLAVSRLKEAYARGVRAIEIKSGYGLEQETEIRILRVIHDLRQEFPQMQIHATYLGAHASPPERSKQSYIKEMIEEVMPRLAKERLADSVDVFIDDGFYDLAEGAQILEAARALGLRVRVHADELGRTTASELGVRLGALSVDHLLHISDLGISALAQSETVGVLLPSTAFFLNAHQAPARKLLDAGACIALATDFNPGTSMTQSLPFVMTLAALQLGMSREEIFGAVTYNAAKALGLESKLGTLEPGMLAEYQISPFPSFEEIYYRVAY